jgi:hypothetical protein
VYPHELLLSCVLNQVHVSNVICWFSWETVYIATLETNFVVVLNFYCNINMPMMRTTEARKMPAQEVAYDLWEKYVNLMFFFVVMNFSVSMARYLCKYDNWWPTPNSGVSLYTDDMCKVTCCNTCIGGPVGKRLVLQYTVAFKLNNRCVWCTVALFRRVGERY